MPHLGQTSLQLRSNIFRLLRKTYPCVDFRAVVGQEDVLKIFSHSRIVVIRSPKMFAPMWFGNVRAMAARPVIVKHFATC